MLDKLAQKIKSKDLSYLLEKTIGDELDRNYREVKRDLASQGVPSDVLSSLDGQWGAVKEGAYDKIIAEFQPYSGTFESGLKSSALASIDYLKDNHYAAFGLAAAAVYLDSEGYTDIIPTTHDEELEVASFKGHEFGMDFEIYQTGGFTDDFGVGFGGVYYKWNMAGSSYVNASVKIECQSQEGYFAQIGLDAGAMSQSYEDAGGALGVSLEFSRRW